MVLEPVSLQWQFIITTVLLAVEAVGEEDWGRRSKNLKWIAVLVSFLWVWDKTATVRCVLNCECMWFKERDRERQGEGGRQRGGREKVLSGQNLLSRHDCPNTVSFPASPSLFLSVFSVLKSLSLSDFLHFSLAASLLSRVTFPLICPFSCKGNHPRYSLISGQGYQRLSSQLGLIASMLMTHRMGNWAPECRQRRWSLLCRLKPRLQIWPGEQKGRYWVISPLVIFLGHMTALKNI